MKSVRVVALVASSLAALPVCAASGTAEASRSAAGTITLGPQQVAPVAQQLRQPPATRIYRSVLADGRVVIGDRPVAAAKTVESWSYELPPADVAQSRADQQRQHWRREAEAFEQRQREREAERRRADEARQVVVLTDPYRLHAPVLIGAAQPLVPPFLVSPSYGSSPGAVRGRSFGFIGSGFSRAAQ